MVSQYSTQYSFQATGCFSIVETTDGVETGMNPEPGIEPATSSSQVCNAFDLAMGLGLGS